MDNQIQINKLPFSELRKIWKEVKGQTTKSFYEEVQKYVDKKPNLFDKPEKKYGGQNTTMEFELTKKELYKLIKMEMPGLKRLMIKDKKIVGEINNNSLKKYSWKEFDIYSPKTKTKKSKHNSVIVRQKDRKGEINNLLRLTD